MSTENGHNEHSGATHCSTPSVVGELRRLADAQISDVEHTETAAEVSAAICQLLGELVLKDDSEDEKLIDWEQEIRELRCKVIGEHDWTFDHCCYWGHQFCCGCHAHKYPELGKLRCSEAKQKIGDITEDEYRATLA